jgi:hypothetical protein
MWEACAGRARDAKSRPTLFKWRHFEPEVIICAVRWSLRFSLSYRGVEELLVELGLPADHTTIWRWVQRYAPELNKRCRRELKPTNGSWRVDETYICQGGNWRYLYRAVDSTGATIDFWFCAERWAAAAKQFLRQFRATLHGAERLRAEVVGLFPPPRFLGGEARAARRRRGPALVAANRASGRAPLVQRGVPALECGGGRL